MRLVLIGPPGSGKGTQAKRIAGHFGIAHISSGELLRRHVSANTAIGRSIQAYISRGDLVPDEVVLDVLREPIEEAARAGGYVLDGFPRTIAQAEAADLAMKDIGAFVQVALYLEVPRAELIRRMLARGSQAGRTDDRLQVITHRLDVFDEVTLPLLDYYAHQEILITIDGAQPVEDVTTAAIDQLELASQRLGLSGATQ